MRERASQVDLPATDMMAMIDLLVSAMEMLSSGLTAPQETEREPDLDSVLQQLAMGFERFLKVTLMEVTRNTTGRRPEAKELKGLSHSLLAVLNALTAEARKVAEYAERPACQADLEFLESEIGSAGSSASWETSAAAVATAKLMAFSKGLLILAAIPRRVGAKSKRSFFWSDPTSRRFELSRSFRPPQKKS